MPSKYNSTAKKPGKAVKKPYNRGGRTAAAMAGRRPSRGARQSALARMAANQPSMKPPIPTGPRPKPPAGATALVGRNTGGRMRRNLRDEEARVIGVQDDAADELRRVRARRPHDAKERADKRAELARVGARGRDAREEMHRLRDKAVGLGMKKGGKTKAKKKQGYNARLDESLGERNKTKGKQSLASRRKESEGMEKAMKRRKYAAVSTMDKGDRKLPRKKKAAKKAIRKKASTASKKRSAALSPKINQHKRMAMGEDVLTGKMIKKASGGKIKRTKAPKRVPSTTGVKLNMGAPKSKTIKSRGMGAAIKGGQFRTNT